VDAEPTLITSSPGQQAELYTVTVDTSASGKAARAAVAAKVDPGDGQIG
jgi:hypothetical protein